ncbi:MAG: septal ring lytic transglycosylase RlpA family protein [Burkholderiales bacterium]|nr:septal ring lytic transglycosylase RlpA family protein [Burkholderiales bacterium]
MRRSVRVCIAALPLVLAACGSAPKKETASPAGKPATASKSPSYYSDDGPPETIPVDLAKIPDATPADEPFHRGASRPYTVFGRTYVPQINNDPFRQTGIASWYGRKFHGQRTAIGEAYDMFAMTAAHPTLPLPSYARVTNLDNRKSVVVRVNDRGPFLHERIIDLSYAAAHRIGIAGPGSGRVLVERVFPGQGVQVAAANVNPSPAGTATGQPGVAAPSASTVATPLPSPAVPIGVPVSASVGVPEQPPVAVVTVPPSTPNPPVVQTAPTPITAEAQGVFIQLGAFGSAENAAQFRERMQRDLNWMREPISVAFANGLHRVRIGPLANREEAEAIAEKMRETHGLTTVISKP